MPTWTQKGSSHYITKANVDEAVVAGDLDYSGSGMSGEVGDQDYLTIWDYEEYVSSVVTGAPNKDQYITKAEALAWAVPAVEYPANFEGWHDDIACPVLAVDLYWDNDFRNTQYTKRIERKRATSATWVLVAQAIPKSQDSYRDDLTTWAGGLDGLMHYRIRYEGWGEWSPTIPVDVDCPD